MILQRKKIRTALALCLTGIVMSWNPPILVAAIANIAAGGLAMIAPRTGWQKAIALIAYALGFVGLGAVAHGGIETLAPAWHIELAFQLAILAVWTANDCLFNNALERIIKKAPGYEGQRN